MGSKVFEKLKKDALDAETLICARCGFCTFVCPAYNDTLWDSQSPRGKLYQLRELIKNNKPIPADFADRIFKCTLCGACQEICQTNIPLLRFWQQIRQEINEVGHWPEVVKFLDNSIQESKNIMDLDQEDRTLWTDMVDDIVEDKIGVPAKVAYFAGCNISFKGTLAPIGESTAKLFDHLGIEFTTLGENEFCCGNPYFVAGEWDKAKELAEHHLSELKRLGVEMVVFNCPGCHRAFNEEYPHMLGSESTQGIEFIPYSEFVVRMMKEGKLKFTQEYNHVVSWHDPCELGRHQNIYNESREVLNAIPGLELREMKHTKNKADCCGGGGLLKGTNPLMSVRISERRIASAEKTGADILSSECPSCMMSFNDGIESKNSEIKFKDLAQIVAEALGL
ncbi:MAG: (Fe-S)-binding protein [Candidatus Thorarchaeota archaeon]|nr:(Fe-S)-binding protein [Candidatus Thorarchaeota archaeon]MCK5238973.1 (Fe-S)-binding protein [Candidatus Thorarchaeota archaeon]